MASGDTVTAMHSLPEEPSTSRAIKDCGFVDGGLNSIQEPPVAGVASGQDRMSAALSRIATTTTIVVGYIP